MPVSLTVERRFAPEAASVRDTQSFVAGQLAEWGQDELAWTAELAVSELATNAVLHAGTADFTVAVELVAGGEVLLRVGDGSRRPPRVRQYGRAATTGRGVALVAELAQDWSVEADQHGKVVWCRLVEEAGGRSRPTAADELQPDGMPDLDVFLSAEDRDDPRVQHAVEPRSARAAA